MTKGYVLVRVLLCACTNREDAVNSETVEAVVARLTEAGCEVVVYPDLCALIGRRDPEEIEAVVGEADGIAGCHPRAIVWLLAGAGKHLPPGFPVLDLKARVAGNASRTVKEWLSSIPADAKESVLGSFPPRPHGDEADAWYPVIDYERCSKCGQCFQFCMFGVYERDETGTVVVSHPSKCKLNCPACARLCPENAIVFPKSPDGAINGAELSEVERAEAEERLALHAKLMQGDVYGMLQSRRRARRKGRPSILRPGALGKDEDR